MKNTITTEQIIAGCRKRQPAFQRALVDNYSEMLFSVCLRYTGNETLAKDVLQESFIRIFKYFKSFDSNKGALNTWMRRITINVALRHLNKKSIDTSTLTLEISDRHYTDPDVMSKIGHDELMKHIMGLPEGYRQVFNLSVIEGYSHKEIAQKIGIKEVSSRSNLSRAKQLLRKKLQSLKTSDQWINSI